MNHVIFQILYKINRHFITITIIVSNLCELKELEGKTQKLRSAIRCLESQEPEERRNAAKLLLHLFNVENLKFIQDQQAMYVFCICDNDSVIFITSFICNL